MKRLAKFVVKRSKLVLFAFIAIVALSTIGGFQSFGNLKGGGYDDLGSDSYKAYQIINEDYKEADPEVVIIVDFKQTLDDPTSVADGQSLADDLAKVEGVTKVRSFFTMGTPAGLRSKDNHATYFFVNIDQKLDRNSIADQISKQFTGEYKSATLYVAGYATVTNEINTAIQHDLLIAESIAVPLVILLLLFVFGSLIAAGLPLLISTLAILGSFFVLWISTLITDTSIFSLNLVTGLGLGLGIDYSLLMVSRYREERGAGHSVDESVRRTIETAGRTVLFSGLTVAVVLSAMFYFPQYFLRSFAVGGVTVVILAVAAALLALPALLKLSKDGVNKLKVIKGDLTPTESKFWGGIAHFVMRRPVAVLLVTVIGLGGLFSLSSGVVFGQVDDRVLPKTNSVVVASNVIRDRFNGRETSPVQVIIEGASQDDITDYTLKLSKLDHIIRVQSTSGIAQAGQLDEGYAPLFTQYRLGDYQRVVAIHDVEPRSQAGMTLTEEIRKLQANGHKVLVGGSAAFYTDAQNGIVKQLPNAGLWIIAWTLILLFLFTGSVLLPIKAVLLNMLSLGATLGFLSWVFINGHLSWLLGDYIATGTLDTSSAVLIAVVAFGLSMDYELFLLSRIKEQHELGLGTKESVATGLAQSGRIITAAALVLAVSFAAFMPSSVTIVKMLGLGIAFAILLDATVVRGLLVPALMRLFGPANWWAPKWMKKIYKAVGLDH